jgi:hypothetical protein
MGDSRKKGDSALFSQMKKGRCPLFALLVVSCQIVCVGTGLCSPGDSVVAVVPREFALSSPELVSCHGFALSTEEMLIALPAQEVGRVLGGTPTKNIKPKPEFPLWIATGRLPDRAVEEAGAHVVHQSEFSTVLEADLAAAHALLSMGYKLVEVKLRRISELREPALGETLLEGLLAGKPLTGARRLFMRGLADSVDPIGIRQTIHRLSYDDEAGEYRSRYACRSDLHEDATPFIADEFARYLGPYGGEIHIAPCMPSVWNCPELPPENIVAHKPGNGTGAHYVICAHYDAIAHREPLWDWQVDPAPGADDNGTGVGVLLECARLLAPLELDVGLKFIAFSGEELGLKGSKCYVDSISLLTDADSILGVINVDMVGYLEDGPKLELVYDWKSKWLSDQLKEAADAAEVETEIEELDLTGIPMSDHFPFWQVGIPGIMFIEELDGVNPVNPYYHTLRDTLDLLDMDQVADNARTIVSFLSRFAPLPGDTLVDIDLTQGSVEWDWEGRNDPDDAPVAGDSVKAKVRALNVGASMDGAYAYEFEVWAGRKGTGHLIHRSIETVELLTGEYAEFMTDWKTDPKMHGNVRFTFVLEPLSSDVEGDLTNNSVEVTLEIMPETAVFENLHVFPNPVTTVPDAHIAFDIYHPDGDFNGMMDIWLFDILGEQIGFGTLERSHAKSELEIGRNAVSLGRFLPSGSDLAPGLYICIAKLGFIGSATTFEATSKFAVDR